jgi:hypothetical protein
VTTRPRDTAWVSILRKAAIADTVLGTVLCAAPTSIYSRIMGHGLLIIALVTVMLGVTVGGVLYQHEVAALLRRLAHRIWPPPEPPAGPPIERIVRDARRLRAELLIPAAGTPMARRIAVSRAYDELLADACRALGIPDTLTCLPLGTEREAERLHVEHDLEAAGVRLTG